MPRGNPRRHPGAAATVASNCVAGIDALLFVFILAPLSPPALSRPAGRERGLTATFGRVLKQKKYPGRGTLKIKIDLEICNSVLDVGCSGFPAVLAGLSSAAAGGSGRALFERSEFRLLGSDTNFAAAQSAVPFGRAKGSANLGSDPKNRSSARNRETALTSAALSFGSLWCLRNFALRSEQTPRARRAFGQQRKPASRVSIKGTRLPGRNPACRAAQ